MVKNNEISDNEAMFRYYNIIDLEESKFNTMRNMDFSSYHYYPNNYYVRGIFLVIFQELVFVTNNNHLDMLFRFIIIGTVICIIILMM